MKKIIGIPGYKNYDTDFFGAGKAHLEFIATFGVPRILMPWEEKVDIDLLYLPGGLDISPDAYDEVPSFSTSNQDVMKEFFFRRRLPNYIKDTPIFGVCMGMQVLGAFFGSKLIQNLRNHPESEDRGETAHSVSVMNDDDIITHKGFKVNSHHHQGILASQLSDQLLGLYKTKVNEPNIEDDSLIEAFKHKKLPIYGVQWHPEDIYDKFSLAVMNKLLK